jgi:heat shock protein HslJ
LVAIAEVIGCGGSGQSVPAQVSTPATPAPKSAATPQDPSALYGDSFVATSATENGQPRQLVPHALISLGFARGRGISWDDGCNSLVAKAGRVTRERLVIAPYGVISTAAECGGLRARQERWLEGFFNANPEWQLSHRSLTLTDAKSTIRFVPRRR